jgi:two-component system, OmpR family, phosphate regulon sensor histidine kinase PhoR
MTPTLGLILGTLIVALTFGLIVLAVRRARLHGEISQITRTVHDWIDSLEVRPLSVDPITDQALTELSATLDRLASSYQRRGDSLRRERPWRTQLVEALTQPALLFSTDERLLAANTAAREFAGLPDSTPGASIHRALGSGTLVEAVRHTQATGAPLTIDLERSGLSLRATSSLVGDEALLVISDRTRERQIEDVRRDFVVNASHELKTPVTAIQTLAEALAVTIQRDPEKAGTLTKRMLSESERLTRLVSDLLDLSRLEERGPLERIPVDLAAVVRECVAELIPRAEARNITMSVEAPERANLAGIPTDIEAIVKNLVTNAIKYNHDGGTVTIRLAPQDGDQVLSVIDTGIGIPPQDHSRVFERFYRVDPARSRSTGGTGLGLSIVRNAVERHGGQVSVTSVEGSGTTFTVSLPIGYAT